MSIRLLVISLLPLLLLSGCQQPKADHKLAHQVRLPIPPIKRLSQEQYGIDVAAHQVIQDSFPEDALLTDLLQSYGIEAALIDSLDQEEEGAFSVRRMQAGNPFTILRNNDTREVDFFIYEETEEEFVMIDFRHGLDISRGSLPVQSESRELYLPIETNLYEAVTAAGVDVSLVKSLERIFAWKVDFFQLDRGDYCKVIYEQRFVDGSPIGIGNVLAAEFFQGGRSYQAFFYETDSVSHYYDARGFHVRGPFLTSPLAQEPESGSGISTLGPSQQRLYPGNPEQAIIAVGSGTIEKITGKPGNFTLLLRHSDVYATQYAHLSTIPDSLQIDQTLLQGDTLGYVGRLPSGKQGVGLRFWKQGQPIAPPRATPSDLEGPQRLTQDKGFEATVERFQRRLRQLGPIPS